MSQTSTFQDEHGSGHPLVLLHPGGTDSSAFDANVPGLVGHSDGAIVGLHAARLRPDLVRGLVFSSGVYHHEGWLPGTELDDLHHREPALTTAELEAIATPTLVMVADGDEVAWEHVLAMHRHLPHAQLAVVPGEDHGHPAGRPDLFAAMVTHFLRGC